MAAGGGDDDKSRPSSGEQRLFAAVWPLPADLAATAALVVLTDLAALLPVVSETPLRIGLGLPFLLFLPGYALVSALFPEAGPGSPETEGVAGGERDCRIDGLERVTLAFALSLIVVPVVGIGLHFTPWGLRLGPILAVLSGVTLAFVAVAAVRRRRLPPAERFGVPYRDWLAAARGELLAPETRGDAVLNVALAVGLVAALAFAGYVVAVPQPNEQFTEFSVLAEDDTGDLVAAGYPTNFTVGEPKPVVLGVRNHEHEAVRYSIVVRLQDATVTANGTTVERQAELDRLRTGALAHNETWRRAYAIAPTFAGERLRVQFLLYRGEAPSRPTAATADHELHLWVSVSASG